MRLKSVTLQKFRNFVEPQSIEIEEDVTCLVGKNESGKTTVLKALHRLNPATGSDLKFNLTIEYPRWRLARDRKQNTTLAKTSPIQAVFVLDAADLAKVEGVVGVTLPANTTAHAWRNYDNAYSVSLSCPMADVIRASASHVQIAPEDLNALLAAPTYAEARSTAQRLAKDLKEADPLRSKAVNGFPAALDKYAAVTDDTMEQDARNALWALLPKFFYFSNYNVLPGETDLTELAAKISAGTSLTDEERSIVALLNHAGEEPKDFMDADYDSRKAELQAASVDLSQRVFEYWRQNDDLEVIFDTDNVVHTESPSGNQITHRILKIELRDGLHGNVETNFSTRSTGFQWFFSFFAAFSEYQDSAESIVVLLDEPGTSLHGEAQQDFVRFIFQELGASKQVLYTTHSQHLVDPTKYEKLRAVHDKATRKNPDLGVAVTPINLSADKSTLLPVESALGYSVSSHLFLGSGQHLTVEGGSDFVYLQRMTEHLLADQGQASNGLDPQLAMLPVGGIDNMPAFVALLGRRLGVSALVDGDRTNAKLARIKKAAAANGVPESSIVVCSYIEGLPTNADIEDLFELADYLRLYNWAFGDNLTAADLASTDEPIIKRITDVKGDFDHALPAHALTMHRAEFFATIQPKTIEQFVALFAKLNATVAAS